MSLDCSKRLGFGSAKHVVIIGIDGFSTVAIRDAFQRDGAPFIKHLCQQLGAFTDGCRSVYPTWSMPNWAAALCSADPATLGIIDNEWKITSAAVPSIVGARHHFPNLFSVARAQRPEAFTAAVYTWEGIADILLPSTDLNVSKQHKHDADTVRDVCDIIKTHQPLLTFIHLDDLDILSHEKGYGPEFDRELKKVDNHVKDIFTAIDDAGIRDRTLVLIMSDHGRDAEGKDHGGFSLSELETPWIAVGPGVRTGVSLNNEVSVSILDTSSTALFALGLQQPFLWRGRPVLNLYDKNCISDDIQIQLRNIL